MIATHKRRSLEIYKCTISESDTEMVHLHRFGV